MAEASALRRTVRGQPQQTEQDSRAEQSRPQQAGSRQNSSRADRSDPATALNPGVGVWPWTPGGMNRARDSQRCGSVAKIASPYRYSFPSGQIFCISSPAIVNGGGERSRFGSVGAFFMCISFPLIMRQHLLSSSGMRVRSAALLRAGPQSHFDCTKEMKAAWR